MRHFEVVGRVSHVEAIATTGSIREQDRLREEYGPGRWRKMKGIAMVRLRNGRLREAEIHWYEAHGIGKKEVKRKKYLDVHHEGS